MKTKFLVLSLLSASLFLFSCKGDKGELGPKGDKGDKGETGATGPQGQAGTPANVIYSNWMDVDATPYTYDNTSDFLEEMDFSHRQIIATPKLTADIADKGVVLMYYKNAQGRIFQVVSSGDWSVPDLYDRDGNGDLFESWRSVYYSYKVGEIRFYIGTAWSGQSTLELNDTGATIRYILIPGLTEVRASELKKLSYEEVVKLYNIKDK